MPIIDELLQEHATLKELFLDAKELGENAADREALLGKLRGVLTAHARAEEQTLYVRMAAKDRGDVLEGEEEHHLIDTLLRELATLSVADEHWAPKLEVLRESALHHLKEEEESLFPRANRVMAAGEAEEIGAAYRQAFARELQSLA